MRDFFKISLAYFFYREIVYLFIALKCSHFERCHALIRSPRLSFWVLLFKMWKQCFIKLKTALRDSLVKKSSLKNYGIIIVARLQTLYQGCLQILLNHRLRQARQFVQFGFKISIDTIFFYLAINVIHLQFSSSQAWIFSYFTNDNLFLFRKFLFVFFQYSIFELLSHLEVLFQFAIQNYNENNDNNESQTDA